MEDINQMPVVPDNQSLPSLPPKKATNIYIANLLIFLGYYLLGLSFPNLRSKEWGTFGSFALGGYLVHAGVLIIISIVLGISGLIHKTKTRALHYFLAAIILSIVGFGACFFAFANIWPGVF